MTLVRRQTATAAAAPENTCYVVMPETVPAKAEVFTQELRKRAPRAAPLVTLDPGMPRQQVDELLGKLAGCPDYRGRRVCIREGLPRNRGLRSFRTPSKP